VNVNVTVTVTENVDLNVHLNADVNGDDRGDEPDTIRTREMLNTNTASHSAFCSFDCLHLYERFSL
jgi:hypothetical protein